MSLVLPYNSYDEYSYLPKSKEGNKFFLYIIYYIITNLMNIVAEYLVKNYDRMKNNGLNKIYMRRTMLEIEFFFLLDKRCSSYEEFWSKTITDLHHLRSDSSIGETLDDLGCVRLAYEEYNIKKS